MNTCDIFRSVSRYRHDEPNMWPDVCLWHNKDYPKTINKIQSVHTWRSACGKSDRDLSPLLSHTHSHTRSLFWRLSGGIKAQLQHPHRSSVCFLCAQCHAHVCVRVCPKNLERQLSIGGETDGPNVRSGEFQLFWRQSRSTEQQTFPFWSSQHNKTRKKTLNTVECKTLNMMIALS